MGELGGEEIPEEWKGVYNIKSTFLYDIRKDYPNSSPLILENPINIQTNLSVSESIENLIMEMMYLKEVLLM